MRNTILCPSCGLGDVIIGIQCFDCGVVGKRPVRIKSEYIEGETGDAPKYSDALRKFRQSRVTDAMQYLEVPEHHAPAVRSDSSGVSDHVHVRAYDTSNWWSTWGVLKKRREIEALGLPSFYQWRFLTLTVDQEKFESPLEAFLVCREDLRRFGQRCRDAGLWTKDTPWCWKLEFQANGWPHWHMLVGRRKKYTDEQLKSFIKLWPHGRPSCEMVRNDDFLYSFKYAFKPVIVEDESQPLENCYTLPSWFLDYMGVQRVKVEDEHGNVTFHDKPVSFHKVRFWQTSKNFYTGKPRPRSVSKPQETWQVPIKVSEHIEITGKRVHLIARDRRGKYLSSAVAVLSISLFKFWTLSGWHAAESKACFLGKYNAVIPTHIIQQHTQNKWQLKHHLHKNRLTLKRAVKLQAEHQTLQKC